MSDRTNRRKMEHIRVIHADKGVDRKKFYFDDVLLRHRALPEINLRDVDTSTTFLGKKLSVPLLISSMTGGDHATLRKINANLAKAAEKCGVAMGVGSQRVMFDNTKARKSFELREYAPTALLIANIGAVQLNNGFSITECRAAVDALDADALYLHLNPLQEAVQPEGDTNFRNLAARIAAVQRGLKVPVILKEVGAGLSLADARLGVKAGIRFFDVAGSGGTSWSRIEHHRKRNADSDLGMVFQDWGIPTPVALNELRPLGSKVKIIASGGIRSGIDIVKALALGASLAGLASPFLRPAMKSADAVVAEIERIRREVKTAMFLLGVKKVKDLIGNRSLVIS